MDRSYLRDRRKKWNVELGGMKEVEMQFSSVFAEIDLFEERKGSASRSDMSKWTVKELVG